MIRTLRAALFCSAMALTAMGASPALAADCSDILAHGTFDYVEAGSDEAAASSFVNHLLANQEFVNFMQSQSSGNADFGYGDFHLGGGGGGGSTSREEFRSLLAGYARHDVEAMRRLRVMASTASAVIATAWQRCMEGSTGLNVSFQAIGNTVAVAFRYDDGQNASRKVRIRRIVGSGGVSRCSPGANLEVGRGPSPVICRRTAREGIITITSPDVAINNHPDGIFRVPARAEIAAVINTPIAPPPLADQLRNGDLVYIRFTVRGDWYLTSAGPGGRIGATRRTAADLQANSGFHALRLIKTGGSGGPAINSGDALQLEEECCGHHRYVVQAGLLEAAADPTAGTDFTIQIVGPPQQGPILNGNYVYLRMRDAQDWLTHDPDGSGQDFPSFRVGAGDNEVLFIRRTG